MTHDYTHKGGVLAGETIASIAKELRAEKIPIPSEHWKRAGEGNATGKIPDRHFTRLLAEYDEEQAGLETSITEWQRQIESWNADKLKTDQFIQLVKRYTDFSELTTPMLNEFIEKVVVHEGEGRGNDRRQRIDIYLNFIGAFEVPAHIVTPAEVEEQRRQQEEQAAKDVPPFVYPCGRSEDRLDLQEDEWER